MQKVKVEKVHETYREEVCYNPHPNTPPMHAPFCFGIRTFFLNRSRGKPYENNKQREWERKGRREREQHCKSWKCRFSSLVDFSNFPDLGNFYEKSQNSDLVALPPSELFLLRSCVLWHSLSHYPRSLSFSHFLEQALLIPYSSSLCVFRFPVKTLRRQ